MLILQYTSIYSTHLQVEFGGRRGGRGLEAHRFGAEQHLHRLALVHLQLGLNQVHVRRLRFPIE